MRQCHERHRGEQRGGVLCDPGAHRQGRDRRDDAAAPLVRGIGADRADDRPSYPLAWRETITAPRPGGSERRRIGGGGPSPRGARFRPGRLGGRGESATGCTASTRTDPPPLEGIGRSAMGQRRSGLGQTQIRHPAEGCDTHEAAGAEPHGYGHQEDTSRESAQEGLGARHGDRAGGQPADPAGDVVDQDPDDRGDHHAEPAHRVHVSNPPRDPRECQPVSKRDMSNPVPSVPPSGSFPSRGGLSRSGDARSSQSPRVAGRARPASLVRLGIPCCGGITIPFSRRGEGARRADEGVRGLVRVGLLGSRLGAVEGSPGAAGWRLGEYAWYVVQNRPGLLLPIDLGLIETGKPAMVVTERGVPLLWIFPYSQVVEWAKARRGSRHGNRRDEIGSEFVKESDQRSHIEGSMDGNRCFHGLYIHPES